MKIQFETTIKTFVTPVTLVGLASLVISLATSLVFSLATSLVISLAISLAVPVAAFAVTTATSQIESKLSNLQKDAGVKPKPQEMPKGSTEIKTQTGEARLKDGTVFYRQEHVSFGIGKSSGSVIRYLRPTGEVFAELKSEPSVLALLPNTHFEDHRDHYEYKMDVPDQNHARFSVRDSEKSEWKTSIESVDSQTFILQTLPLFLSLNEDKLKSFTTFEAKLAMVSRRSVERVRITAARKPNNPSENAAANLIEVQIEPASFLLRKLLPASTVIYDTNSHLVVEFKGTSNILDDEDKSKDVEIKYQAESHAQHSSGR